MIKGPCCARHFLATQMTTPIVTQSDINMLNWHNFGCIAFPSTSSGTPCTYLVWMRLSIQPPIQPLMYFASLIASTIYLSIADTITLFAAAISGSCLLGMLTAISSSIHLIVSKFADFAPRPQTTAASLVTIEKLRIFLNVTSRTDLSHNQPPSLVPERCTATRRKRAFGSDPSRTKRV